MPVESLAGLVTAIALLAVSYAGLFALGAVEPEEEHLRRRLAEHWRRLRAVVTRWRYGVPPSPVDKKTGGAL